MMFHVNPGDAAPLAALSVDRAALPAALLDIAKSHLRVRHDRDDLLIGQHLAMAIDQVERRCNINLNPAVFTIDPLAVTSWPVGWWPANTRYVLPVNNVHDFTLLDGEGVDQSDGYAIEQADLGGSASAYLVGAPLISGAGWALTLEVGVDDPDALTPAVLAAVLRLTGGYYENRESPSAVVVGDFLGELASVWRPSA